MATLNDDQLPEVIASYQDGVTVTNLAHLHGVSSRTIRNSLKEAGVYEPNRDKVRYAPPGELTECQLNVLRGMAAGRSNSEIARELFISEDTVKTHARRMYRRLDARDRAHAIARAYERGILTADQRSPQRSIAVGYVVADGSQAVYRTAEDAEAAIRRMRGVDERNNRMSPNRRVYALIPIGGDGHV
jgi:DNA-binding CsgD family transcriptional regulator